MSGALFESRATQLAMQAVDLLCNTGRVEVLEHILCKLHAQGFVHSADEIISLVRDQVFRTKCLPEEGALALRERVATGIERYAIRELGRSAVELKLPKGSSRFELLREVSDVSADLFGKQYVNPQLLHEWSKQSRFLARAQKGGELIRVEVNIPESKLKNFAEQKALGFNQVSLPDLVAAHAAYFLKTSQDLFDDKSVWCNEELLKFYEKSGLGIAQWRLHRANWITASRYLAPEPAQSAEEGPKASRRKNLNAKG
jgi:hypothetical protein